MSLVLSFASAIAFRQGCRRRSNVASASASNLLRLMVMFRCFGPEASAVINGRLTTDSTWVLQFALGLFSGFFQTLVRHRVLTQVDAFGFLEFIGQEVDQDFVQVVTAEVGITVGA